MAEETITISKAELQGMLNEAAAQAVAGAEHNSSRVLQKITERRVEIRLVDNKVVVGFKNRGSEERPVYIYEVPDPMDPKSTISMVDLLLEDNEQNPIPVKFSEFRREGARAICKILATHEKEWEINQGVVRKRAVEEGYSMTELDYDVPLDIIGKVRWFEVEVPKEFGGPRTVKVHENYVNIA